MYSVRVVLPSALRALLQITGEVVLEIGDDVCVRTVLDALEQRFPTLRGTIREYGTLKRRAFVRFYACEQDWSLRSPDEALPDAVREGREPLLVVGAMAGG